MSDWKPDSYARFGDLRLRPALDLLAQVPDLPSGDIVDLGCGAGAVAPALAGRFAGARLIGLDSSDAMLAEARATGLYDDVIRADASQWQPGTAPALIFSNALCHWISDHATLFPRLGKMLAKGGTLAVQMPRQQMAPSHAVMRDIARDMFPERFDFTGWTPQVADPEFYATHLSPLGALSLWETEYHQRLAPVASGHPVRHFTQSTAMRPFAAQLSEDELARFIAAYDSALARAYPLAEDGSVLFPFRRLFFVLTR